MKSYSDIIREKREDKNEHWSYRKKKQRSTGNRYGYIFDKNDMTRLANLDKEELGRTDTTRFN